MKLDITDAHFIELHKKGYTTDMVLILHWLNSDLSVEHIREGSKKIDAIYKTMVRKDLIIEDGSITRIGAEVLTFVSKKTNKTFLKPKVEQGEFDRWWGIFPGNDKFAVRGREFGPTRSFKVKKEACRLLFNSMILEEEFTAQQIIDATEFDINLKKERSWKKNSNQLKYLQNSHTYLNQKTFSGFIGLKKKELIKSTGNTGSIDI